jgi:hypothetical protein
VTGSAALLMAVSASLPVTAPGSPEPGVWPQIESGVRANRNFRAPQIEHVRSRRSKVGWYHEACLDRA